jgi:thiol-disulfide isomerase/thioredoxin
MKLFSFLILAFWSGSVVFASGINFLQISNQSQWEEILIRSKNENKLIFIDFYTDWCGWCKKMDREVFSIEEVGSYFNKEFINLKIDAENKELGSGLSSKFNVEGFPTYLFLDKNQNVVSTLVGFQQQNQLIESGRSALKSWKLLPQLKEKAEKGTLKDTELRDYSVLVAKKDGTQAAQEYADRYIKTFKNENLTKPEDFEFATFFLKDINSSTFNYFAQNYKRIAESVGVEKVDEYKYMIFEDNFMKAVAKNDENQLNELIAKLIPIYLDDASQAENDMLRFTMQIGFYERTENWDKFENLIEDFRDQKAEDKTAFIYAQCEKIAMQMQQPRLVSKAINWMQAALNQSKTFDNHFLMSILQLQNQNSKEAEKHFNMAKDLAQTEEEKQKIDELQKYIKP